MKPHLFKILFFLFYFFADLSFLSSRPEKHDPLDTYKQKDVSVQGPVEERFISINTNAVLARAEHTYNARNQLIQTDYFLAGQGSGRRTYIYDQNGLPKENVYNAGHELVEVITYQTDPKGKIISYSVAPEGIHWNFRYKGSVLKSGKRLARDGSKTESFTFRYRNKSILIQYLFSGDDRQIASVWHIYKKNRLVERTRKEGSGNKKAKYIYDHTGRLQEILWYDKTDTGKFQLARKQRFKYF